MTPPVSLKPQSSSGNFFQMVFFDMFNARYSSFYIVLYFFFDLSSVCREELNCDKNHPSGCPAQICWVSFKTWASPAPSMFLAFIPLISSFLLFSCVVNLVSVLQMEAAWVLTNIAASDYTLLVAECGAVPRLVELLGSPNANIRHQVKQLYWILINISVCNGLVCDIVGSDMLSRLSGVLGI